MRTTTITMTTRRSYSEARHYQTFEERFAYLALRGQVGNSTFGFDRWMNQAFYRSAEWKKARRDTIARDNGCDLGFEGYEIHRGLYVHHINPITPADIENSNPCLLDLNNLITVSLNTHNAIHFGDESLLPRAPVERRPGDTKLW